ncbi:hypothetical protein C5L14_03030 [Labrys okinawensis]|uniref:AprE-like beta-barrel domain-containing protein n=2 Tax=Labrys okinawensis TaxID=346911 RepID=A0A2S9QJN0_9HYPH|nr:hypothetical protein C5L14_03030 [Labrys okinawensis]
MRGAAIMAIILIGLFCLFIVFGSYTRRVRVQGVVLPTEGVTRIIAPVQGWISNQKVKEGDSIRQGDVLYTITLERTTSLGSTEGAVVDLLRRQHMTLKADLRRQDAIDRSRRESLQAQQAVLTREAEQISNQIAIAQQNTDTFKEMTAQRKDYLSRGISTLNNFQALLQSYMNQQTQLEQLKRERVQIDAKLADIRDQLSSFDLHAAAERSKLQQQVIGVERQIAEDEAQREIVVTAPRSGKATSIITQLGQTVAAGTPLLSILPEGMPSEAQLLAPTSAIGFVQKGNRVLLRYAAFPYQKFCQFPGTISLISRVTLRPEEVSQFFSGGSEKYQGQSFYRVTVRPDQDYVLAYGKREPLQIGMQLEADLLADSRPLYQWALEPLYGLRGSFISTGTGS